MTKRPLVQNVSSQNVSSQKVPSQNFPLQYVPSKNVPSKNVPSKNVSLKKRTLKKRPLKKRILKKCTLSTKGYPYKVSWWLNLPKTPQTANHSLIKNLSLAKRIFLHNVKGVKDKLYI